jgi:ribonuclease BN (tRNA processing enzyme)
MKLKIMFLGSGAAFTRSPENYQSNVLLSMGEDTLLIDAGSDLRHSIREQGLGYKDIRNVYISHLHADHCGGLEWLALLSHFDPEYKGKPRLFTAEEIMWDLWDKTLSGGLRTLRDMHANIGSYFDTQPIKPDLGFKWQGIDFQLVKAKHYYDGCTLMPTYGLIFSHNNTRVFFTADCQFTPEQFMPYYEKSDIIFHDCEILKKPSQVHSHYLDLAKLPDHIKQKMWLYHYNSVKLPDAKKDKFLGFVTKGQCFLI